MSVSVLLSVFVSIMVMSVLLWYGYVSYVSIMVMSVLWLWLLWYYGYVSIMAVYGYVSIMVTAVSVLWLWLMSVYYVSMVMVMVMVIMVWLWYGYGYGYGYGIMVIMVWLWLCRKGYIITYRDVTNINWTQRYNSDDISDAAWTNPDNWEGWSFDTVIKDLAKALEEIIVRKNYKEI